jgi:tripartite-type tricarboxylate transporter receptor subunit TctC
MQFDHLKRREFITFIAGAAALPAVSRITAATGKLRPLAVTTRMPFAALPDVPVLADFVPGYESSALYGFAAPKNTSPEIVAT